MKINHEIARWLCNWICCRRWYVVRIGTRGFEQDDDDDDDNNKKTTWNNHHRRIVHFTRLSLLLPLPPPSNSMAVQTTGIKSNANGKEKKILNCNICVGCEWINFFLLLIENLDIICCKWLYFKWLKGLPDWQRMKAMSKGSEWTYWFNEDSNRVQMCTPFDPFNTCMYAQSMWKSCILATWSNISFLLSSRSSSSINGILSEESE